MAAWAPLVPFAKERLGIQEGALGTLLLCLGAGSIVAMPLAGILTSRFGCRRVLILSVGVVCATLPMLAQVSSVTLLGLALLLLPHGPASRMFRRADPRCLQSLWEVPLE